MHGCLHLSRVTDIPWIRNRHREELEVPLQVELLLDDKEADKRVAVPAGRAQQVLEVDPKEPRLGRNGKVSR